MKKLLTAALGITLAACASAALPPQYQNAKDLDVMIAFAKQHQRVISTLKSIDLQTNSVSFGEDCVARFTRTQSQFQPGLVGPAAPLVFSSSNCPLQ
jgi:hypothetical protein